MHYCNLCQYLLSKQRDLSFAVTKISYIRFLEVKVISSVFQSMYSHCATYYHNSGLDKSNQHTATICHIYILMFNKLIVSKGCIITISMVLAKRNCLMLYNGLWDPWEQVDPCTSWIPAELPLVETIPSSESIIINFLVKLLLTSAKTSLCYY